VTGHIGCDGEDTMTQVGTYSGCDDTSSESTLTFGPFTFAQHVSYITLTIVTCVAVLLMIGCVMYNKYWNVDTYVQMK